MKRLAGQRARPWRLSSPYRLSLALSSPIKIVWPPLDLLWRFLYLHLFGKKCLDFSIQIHQLGYEDSLIFKSTIETHLNADHQWRLLGRAARLWKHLNLLNHQHISGDFMTFRSYMEYPVDKFHLASSLSMKTFSFMIVYKDSVASSSPIKTFWPPTPL